MPTTKKIVVAVTGASGAVYAARLCQILLRLGHELHCVVSPTASQVVSHELNFASHIKKNDCVLKKTDIGMPENEASCCFPAAFHSRQFVSWFSMTKTGKEASPNLSADELDERFLKQATTYSSGDFFAAIASGSFQTDGMVVVPCSTGTLGAIAAGTNQNLIHRVAEVHLKERRRLVLVVRETPFSAIHIENMQRITAAGGIVLPASPSFYQQPATPGDLVDTVISRVLDQIAIPHNLTSRWPDGHL